MNGVHDLPPLRDIIDAHDLRAKKSLGQNFLLDLNITQKIVRLCGDLSALHVVEIGPGPGGLTRAIVESGARHVTAIEFDSRAISALDSLVQASQGTLDVIEGDAMKVDIISLSSAPRAIIANLPYNIATPLLIGWLKQLANDHKEYDVMALMFQKEVAMRICAKKGDKHYGRLAIISQWLCNVDVIVDLPPQAFNPPPKVNSSVVRFLPKVRSDGISFQTLEHLTEKAFGQRRKMIRQSLKAYVHLFDEVGLNAEIRAQDMDIEDFIKLAQCLKAHG